MVHPDRKKEKSLIDAQIIAMESIQQIVEGKDDRTYIIDKKT